MKSVVTKRAVSKKPSQGAGLWGRSAVAGLLLAGQLIATGLAAQVFEAVRPEQTASGQVAPGQVAPEQVGQTGVRGREYVTRWLAGQEVGPLGEALRADHQGRRRPLPAPSVADESLQEALAKLVELARQTEAGNLPGNEAMQRAVTELLAADLLVRERFTRLAESLAEGGIAGAVPSRLAEAEAGYQAFLDPLLALLPVASDVASAAQIQQRSAEVSWTAAFAELGAILAAPPQTVLRSNLLPFRPVGLAPRPPTTEPAVVPAYLDPSDPAPVSEDFAGSASAPLSEEILVKAEELGYDYVRVYEFVRNEIETELYFGGLKGALGVLRSGRGNDVDQASLLVALLRACQAPARYVHGVVEMTLEEAGASLGLSTADSVTVALARAGLPHEPVIRGGVVAGVRVEHTWVESYLPYTNYRGAVVDFTGRTWIPLAPSIVGFDSTPPTAILRQMAFDSATFLADYLATPQSEEPLAVLRQQIEAYLAANGGGTYADQLGTSTPRSTELGILPSTLPVPVIAVTGEGVALAEDRRHEVRFLARGGTAESDPPILDITVPHTEVDGARVTLSYQPATVDDHRTINFFGGLGLVPAYLVELRPVLKVDGRVLVVGEAIAMAAAHRLEVEVSGSNGEAKVDRIEVAGNFLAFAFGSPRVSERQLSEEDLADTETLGPKLLSQLAYTYGERWDAAEDELGDLFDVAVVRPLPSLVIAANAIEVSQLAGLPSHLDWQGVTLDALLRIAEPVDRGGVAARDWMRLAALQGSALEHGVFESEFLVESISADKGLGLARQAGQEIFVVDATNVGALLPLLEHPADVEAEVERWALLGQTVEVPRRQLTLNAWTGSVWRVEDPTSGAGGYFLTGGLNGGQTTEPPGSWVLDFLEDALAGAFSASPNTDPLAGEVIVFLAESDDQTGEVGDELPVDLTVKVSDGDGRPVEGAVVFFSSAAGGGTMISFEEDPNTGLPIRMESDEILAVRTNNLGLASITLELGESTFNNSVYPLREPLDEHETQASLHLVDAAIESHLGILSIPRYLSALVFPGPADHLEADQISYATLLPSAWAGNFRVRPVDEHRNPVSNVSVTFTVAEEFDDGNGCIQRPHLPAEVFDREACEPQFPLPGQCGSGSVTLDSTRFGVAAAVLTGSGGGIAYLVDAEAGGLGTLRSAWVVFQGQACRPLPEGLAVIGGEVPNTFGDNISAAGLGQLYEPPIFSEFFDREFDSEGIFRWIPMLVDDINASISGDGFITPPVPTGFQYRSLATVGSSPQEHEVTVTGQDPFNNGNFLEASLHIFAAEPRITQVSPDPYVLSPDGVGATDLEISFGVLPEELSSQTREIFIYENGESIGLLPINSVRGDSFIALGKGFPFDLEQDYTLELVLNRGTEVEVRSEPFRLPLDQQIIRSYDPGLAVSREVDLPNGLQCSIPTIYNFSLTRQATVNLVLERIEAINPDGTQVLGSELRLINDQTFEEGDHTLDVTPDDVPPGDYRLTLTARDGDQLEERLGSALSQFTSRDSLPVGQSLVKGVNPWSGGLALNRGDFQVPGRGPSLAFQRSYSSNAGKDPGVLGVGWVHNYESKIIVTPCSEVIVVGGEGSGMRFVPDGAGQLRPLRGYHGSVVANSADNTFDFFTINGTRYHYVFAAGREWFLHEISDPNGNTTTLSYTPSNNRPLLRRVTDSSGGSLTFTYTFQRFPLWSGDLLTAVSGPDGLNVAFAYDDNGNLIQASREAGAAIEAYDYEVQPSSDHEARSALKSTTNGLSGATTTYTYSTSGIGFEGGMFTGLLVTSVTEPLGGTTSFDYDEESLATRANSLVTEVIDRLGETSVYTFDSYGSPQSIEDPLSHTMTMSWDLSDVVLSSRTDANGVTTSFEYDEHGNVTRETVAGAETVTTYEAPGSFNPPFIKNRVKTRTDRNGNTTTFVYDSRGNLKEQRIQVSHPESGSRNQVTKQTYATNGDRLTTTDPEGQTTSFAYDTFGNVVSVTDPQGFTAENEWNERGLRIRQEDPLGRETTIQYDRLGRVLSRLLPDDSSQTFAYDDAANTRTETDAAGNVTVTEFDLEGRVKKITNATGAAMVAEYDAEGRKIFESTWFGDDTPRVDVTFEYDEGGRLIRRVEPLGRITSYEHDPAGNLLRETLSGGGAEFVARVTESDYDDLNRPVEIRRLIEGGPATTAFGYDGEGNKVREVDGLGRETLFEYDEVNRLVRMTEPEARVTLSFYDGNSNLIKTKFINEPTDQIREFTYDPSNRLLSQTDAVGIVRSFEYDAVGNVVTEIDGRGNVTRHTYDERNRRRTTTVPTEVHGDVTTSYDYDNVGNLKEERLANGNVVVHVHDELSRLLSSTDTLGPVAEFAYDARGNRVREVDAKGNVTTNVFDALDRLIRRELPEDRTLLFDYDVAGNRTAATDARGNTSTATYDALDRLVGTTDPAPFSYTTSREYDLAGNVLAQTDRRGQIVTFEVDGLDRVTRRIDPAVDGEQYEVTLTYDAASNVLTQTDRRGIVTESQFDAENRTIQVMRDGLVIGATTYDGNGNPRTRTDANGNTTTLTYDERNLLIEEARPLSVVSRFEYSPIGDRVRVVDAENKELVLTYDARRRPETETRFGDNGAETTTFGYDGKGNRTSIERPEGGVWLSEYDAADRLVAVTDPEQNRTEYVWDKNSNLEDVFDAAGNPPTVLAYDELNRLVSRTFPDGASEFFDYDENGNLIEKRDAKGQVFINAYDALNRPTERSFPPDLASTDDLQSIVATYDPNNNVLDVTESFSVSGSQITTRTFDTFDRLQRVVDRWGNSLTYGYDANGNRTQLTDPDGKSTLYGFDELNRLRTVNLSGGGLTQYDYLLNGRLDTITYPNGTTAAHVYDDANRVKEIHNLHNAATVVSSYLYAYDLNGNRVEQIETQFGLGSETTTYTYDLADRLTDVAYPDKTTSYTYDAVGNRLSEIEHDLDGNLITNKVFTYDPRDQLTDLENLLDPNRNITYGHDANGNQISRDMADGTFTELVFNVRDQLVQIAEDGSPLGTYGYDSTGLRITKQTAEGLARYVYDERSVLLRTDPTGSKKYDYGPDRLLSVQDSVLGRAYYLFDALGSVVDLTTPTGTLLGQYQYDAWGNVRSSTDTAANIFGFTGHEMDGESGLIYAKARFYDPEIGRFLSHDPQEGDPSNPPSLHRYLYAFSNPTTFVDPTGEIPILNEIKDFFKGGGVDNAAEAAGDIQEEFGTAAGVVAGVLLGIGGAAADAVAGAVEIVDTVANAVVAGVAPDSELGQQAAAELNETIDTVTETVKTIAENPGAVGAALVDGVVETAKGVLTGDAEAITRATAAIADLATGGKSAAGGVARKAGKVAGTVADGTKAVTKRLDNVAGDLAKNTNRANRRRKQAASSGRNAKPEKPAAGTRGDPVKPKMCFVAGTLVATQGGLKPIEEVAVGELVWARSEETGQESLRPVEQLFETPDQQVWEVEVESADGSVETIGTTVEHPFWVVDLGWVPASRLQPGDRLATNVDGWLEVRQVRGSPRRETVYNFEVAEDHTYFVGETGAWVHNLCEEGKARVLANIAESRKARQASNLGGGVNRNPLAISNKNARRLIENRELARGLSRADARQNASNVVQSFKGQISARNARRGEVFEAFSGADATRPASGVFLTRGLQGTTNSLERQILLALPDSNSAIRSSAARLTRDQILLEGVVRGQQGGIFGNTFKAGGAFQAVTPGGRFSGAVELLSDAVE